MKFRLAIFSGFVAVFLLTGLAGTKPGQVVAKYIVTTVTDVINPIPSPSPTGDIGNATTATAAPVAPPVIDEPTPSPTEEPFPDKAPAPTPIVLAPSSSTQTPTETPPIPQTSLSVGVVSKSDNAIGSGPFTCSGPCTITWQACFQGGFTGSTVEQCGTELADPNLTFTWSNGHVGTTDTVIYNATETVSVRVTETYQGHIYAAGSDAGVKVTVQ